MPCLRYTLSVSKMSTMNELQNAVRQESGHAHHALAIPSGYATCCDCSKERRSAVALRPLSHWSAANRPWSEPSRSRPRSRRRRRQESGISESGCREGLPSSRTRPGRGRRSGRRATRIARNVVDDEGLRAWRRLSSNDGARAPGSRLRVALRDPRNGARCPARARPRLSATAARCGRYRNLGGPRGLLDVLQLEALDRDLEDAFGLVDTAEVALPEREDRDALRQPGAEERACRLRKEDLAASADGADARRTHDVEPDVSLLVNGRLACVQSHPDADVDLARPRRGRVGTLRVDRRLERVSRAREHEEERVALGIDLDAVAHGERVANDSPVRRQHLAVSSPSRLRSSVESSMSVNTKVTVPPGSSGTGRS